MKTNEIDSLCQLIFSVFEKKADVNTISEYRDIMPPEITWKNYSSDEILLECFSPVNKVLILIQGNVQIHNYSIDGNKSIQGIMPAPEFFGLIEALTDTSVYTSSVVAAGPVTAVTVPVPLLEKALRTNIELANVIIKKLAQFANIKMDEAVEENTQKPIDTLILFLYKYTEGKKLPHTILMKRSELSGLLHIELRTLYRYLNTLQNRNFCKLSYGKIVITKENFSNLEMYIKENRAF